jgi:hypothetical protein
MNTDLAVQLLDWAGYTAHLKKSGAVSSSGFNLRAAQKSNAHLSSLEYISLRKLTCCVLMAVRLIASRGMVTS